MAGSSWETGEADAAELTEGKSSRSKSYALRVCDCIKGLKSEKGAEGNRSCCAVIFVCAFAVHAADTCGKLY